MARIALPHQHRSRRRCSSRRPRWPSLGLRCTQYATWRVTHKLSRSLRHLHYCDEHLPKKYRDYRHEVPA